MTKNDNPSAKKWLDQKRPILGGIRESKNLSILFLTFSDPLPKNKNE